MCDGLTGCRRDGCTKNRRAINLLLSTRQEKLILFEIITLFSGWTQMQESRRSYLLKCFHLILRVEASLPVSLR